jgi:hypothetical protein
MKTKLAIIISGWITFLIPLNLAYAQVPNSIAGDGFLMGISSGTYPFGSYGYYLFILGDSGNTFQNIGIYNISTFGGTYTYTPTSSSQTTLSINSGGGLGTLVDTFSTTNSGSFYATANSYPGAYQSGVFNLASYTAPSSIAGKTVVCNVSDGLYPFASSGSFTLYVSASGNSYTTDSQGQSGTYSYSLVNRSTGKLQLSDSKAGSFVVYVGFSDALNGGFATTQASTGGFQVGSFQIVPTRIISLGGNLAFGSVTVGASARSTLTINNTGNSITTISSISYPSGFSGNWSGKISAGSSQPVTVTFSPSSATNYGGTVTVNSDMTSGVNTITASGTGVPTYVSVTVQANSTGRSFGVDGANYTKAQTFSWVSGSRHTIATSSPQNGGTGIQYVWSNWSDGGALSHIVSPTNGTTYTANFTTQYFLTMNAGTGGGVSPASGWYDSGTSVPIAAATNTCNSFSGWTGSGSGSYTGTNNPAGVVMDGG